MMNGKYHQLINNVLNIIKRINDVIILITFVFLIHQTINLKYINYI